MRPAQPRSLPIRIDLKVDLAVWRHERNSKHETRERVIAVEQSWVTTGARDPVIYSYHECGQTLYEFTGSRRGAEQPKDGQGISGLTLSEWPLRDCAASGVGLAFRIGCARPRLTAFGIRNTRSTVVLDGQLAVQNRY